MFRGFRVDDTINGTWSGFHAEILKDPLRWEAGYIIPPTKLGLDVELDAAVLEKHSIEV